MGRHLSDVPSLHYIQQAMKVIVIHSIYTVRGFIRNVFTDQGGEVVLAYLCNTIFHHDDTSESFDLLLPSSYHIKTMATLVNLHSDGSDHSVRSPLRVPFALRVQANQ